MYRHVDILNNNRYRAYAVHAIKGFRLTWFDNDTEVVDRKMFSRLYNRNTDYLVLPEDLGERISLFPGKKIIFNQNIYYGFNALGFDRIDKSPYLDKNVKFVMTVSAHNERYLKFTFPNLAIRRVYNGIDFKKFTYRTPDQKKKNITLFPAKAPIDNAFVFQTLSVRARQNLNKLKSYKWRLVGMNSAEEVAKILNQTLIFVFPSIYEGFGLMPLEAMLSGAIVVAYKDSPYSEYLNNTNSFLVNSADKLKLIKTIEGVAKEFESKKAKLVTLSRKAYATARRYSLEREEKSVLKFWEEALHSK